MREISIKIINPEEIEKSKKMLVACARLTQRGPTINNVDDFMSKCYNKPIRDISYEGICNLPHNTLKRFGCINIVIVGASRRFLAQITRHQVGFTFMSASLQYSDYSGKSKFCIPYEIIKEGKQAEKNYLLANEIAMKNYEDAMIKHNLTSDTCGYMAPQGLRNTLIISGNPLAWIQMISTRTCRRNTEEVRYVMLLIWKELYKLDNILFGNCGPNCCKEGSFSCNKPCKFYTPEALLKQDFPLIYK